LRRDQWQCGYLAPGLKGHYLVLKTDYPSPVAHLFEPAATGRSKCRGCARPIQRGELRFGERVPNQFGEGETTLWFHPLCAAYKRPQPLLEALAGTTEGVPDREGLERAALGSVAHERLQRIDTAERSPSGQAKCRSCHEPIVRGSWRIRVVFYEEGRFAPGGYVHLGCRKVYFETDEILDQVLHFSAASSDADREELIRAFDTEQTDPSPQQP
jgi:poly(ADP-ribose) polymerase-like protein